MTNPPQPAQRAASSRSPIPAIVVIGTSSPGFVRNRLTHVRRYPLSSPNKEVFALLGIPIAENA